MTVKLLSLYLRIAHKISKKEAMEKFHRLLMLCFIYKTLALLFNLKDPARRKGKAEALRVLANAFSNIHNRTVTHIAEHGRSVLRAGGYNRKSTFSFKIFIVMVYPCS